MRNKVQGSASSRRELVHREIQCGRAAAQTWTLDISMNIASVEIYSDRTNAAVIRHPGRGFPGVLIQGDTLYSLCIAADASCTALRQAATDEAYDELNELRNSLWGLLNHYKAVLAEHGLPLPFSGMPDV